MTISAWRIVKAKYAEQAFDGEGARRFGGRWNEAGTAVVYLGGSLALAALEIFVHISAADSHLQFVAIQVTFPTDISITTLNRADLPANWRTEPPPEACKALGSTWVRSQSSVALRIPSVIIPEENNYLIDPHHPDFLQLQCQPPRPFGFDNRMWK